MTDSPTIGFLGAGGIATALAGQLTRAGYDVILSNSRGPETLGTVVDQLGGRARAGKREEAAAANIVVLAVPWNRLPEALDGLPEWGGRIVIDATNAIAAPDFKPADLGGRTSSEIVAEMVPGARVVKAFNTLLAETLGADPAEGGGRRVIFLSGDDLDAKGEAATVAGRAGFSTIDLGGLVAGGSLQQFPGGPLSGLNLVLL